MILQHQHQHQHQHHQADVLSSSESETDVSPTLSSNVSNISSISPMCEASRRGGGGGGGEPSPRSTASLNLKRMCEAVHIHMGPVVGFANPGILRKRKRKRDGDNGGEKPTCTDNRDNAAHSRATSAQIVHEPVPQEIMGVISNGDSNHSGSARTINRKNNDAVGIDALTTLSTLSAFRLTSCEAAAFTALLQCN